MARSATWNHYFLLSRHTQSKENSESFSLLKWNRSFMLLMYNCTCTINRLPFGLTRIRFIPINSLLLQRGYFKLCIVVMFRHLLSVASVERWTFLQLITFWIDLFFSLGWTKSSRTTIHAGRNAGALFACFNSLVIFIFRPMLALLAIRKGGQTFDLLVSCHIHTQSIGIPFDFNLFSSTSKQSWIIWKTHSGFYCQLVEALEAFAIIA
jgi:hypothetical protein